MGTEQSQVSTKAAKELFNRKIPARTIELATQGWAWVTNTDDPRCGLDYAEKQFGLKPGTYEVFFEGEARSPYGWFAVDGITMFAKDPEIRSDVPQPVLYEVGQYLSLDKRKRALLEEVVFNEIVRGVNGQYRHAFINKKKHIATILNYYADKLRERGQSKMAEDLENEITKAFPDKLYC